MVDETFREEMESLKGDPEHVEPPLPCKLPKYHICVLENNFVQPTALAATHFLRKEKEKGEHTSMAQVSKKF